MNSIKHLFLNSVVFLFSFFYFSQAFAQMGGYSMPVTRNVSAIAERQIKGLVGLDRGAINLGAEYLSRSGSTGFSGYFLMATEKTAVSKPQLLIFGVGMPLYFYDNRKQNAYITPGLGIILVKNSDVSDTVFGPQIKIGTQFELSPQLHIGLEEMLTTNALSEKSQGLELMTLVTLAFNL